MPRKQGNISGKEVAKRWGNRILKELLWFTETFGIAWENRVNFDIADYTTMEIDPYKVIYYDLDGTGPDGEKASALILVDFKHEYERPSGYDSKGRGYVKFGIVPETIRSSKDRWVQNKAYLTVRFMGEELNRQTYDNLLREVEWGDKGQEFRAKGIKEGLDWS